jgi:hypothetical protein
VPDAAQVLRLAAADARREPVLKARPDQFVYVRSLTAFGGFDLLPAGGERWRPPVEEIRRVWLSVDGTRTGLLRQKPVDPKAKSPRPELADMKLTGMGPPYTKNLPADPANMRAWLFEGTSGSATAAFLKVGEALSEHYLPPDSTAALFEAAATIPGVKVVPGVVDLAGRRGVAITQVSSTGLQSQLIFDSATHAYLGKRKVAVKGHGVPDGTVTGWSAQLEIAIVDRPGQEP